MSRERDGRRGTAKQRKACLGWPVIFLFMGIVWGEEGERDPRAAIVARSFEPRIAKEIASHSFPLARNRRPTPATPPSRPQRAWQGLEKEEPYQRWVDQYSEKYGLDVDLVKAVIQAESGGDPWAVSRKGAIGLMQVMPATAAELGQGNLFDPEHNIAMGTQYLRKLLDRFHSTELALWAYNAGPQAVEQGWMPMETREYVPKVLRLRHHFRSRRGS